MRRCILRCQPVIVTWCLRTNDLNGKPTTILFDVVDGKSQLFRGLEVEHHSVTNHLGSNKNISFIRPCVDNEPRTFKI